MALSHTIGVALANYLLNFPAELTAILCGSREREVDASNAHGIYRYLYTIHAEDVQLAAMDDDDGMELNNSFVAGEDRSLIGKARYNSSPGRKRSPQAWSHKW